ncbi:sulfotransferase [Porifericola rhodea]|uniref:sulfotransferase family protein n=1 Tax=Porifericola rhodea TaxID=930972 RepID=UPI002666D5E4|nr:sulfotransferase [Porifericola rhodea]WKN33584.1 sulfotransferase [Porifericola rhodea]
MTQDYCWPNLFVPGAGKSGTTSLHHYLNQHPDIWMSEEKEPVYFNNPERWQSEKSRKYYLSLFVGGKTKLYRGESSTGYMTSEGAIGRIKSTVTEPKFIFILRNPIDRAFSHYKWLLGSGFEKRPFKEAFLDSYHCFKQGKTSRPSYYSESLYYYWINRYLTEFRRDNVHILTTEDLHSDTLNQINLCFEFLELRPLKSLKNTQSNESVILHNPSIYNKFSRFIAAKKKGPLMTFYQSLLPAQYRMWLRRKIIGALEYYKYHLAKHSPMLTIEEEDRQWLKHFFQKDVVNLMATFPQTSFKSWKDFL